MMLAFQTIHQRTRAILLRQLPLLLVLAQYFGKADKPGEAGSEQFDARVSQVSCHAFESAPQICAGVNIRRGGLEQPA